MLKILYLPINSYGQPQSGMYDAFLAAGVDMQIYDFHIRWLDTKNKALIADEFVDMVQNFNPDLVHMQLQMTGIIEPETIVKARTVAGNRNILFTNWSGDVRNTVNQYFVNCSKVVDYSFISSTGQIPMYEKAGCKNLRYWQIGYDDKIFYPKYQKDFEYDVVFAGNSYTPDTFQDAALRNRLLTEIRAKFGERFQVFGAGFHASVFGKRRSLWHGDLNNAYNKAKCIISISNYNDVSNYFSDRLLTCMASGRPTISYRFPDYHSYFSDGSDILIGHSSEEMIKHINDCLNNPEKADRIGRNGANKVIAEHTYKSRIIELLEMLNLQ